jgi:predicted secreted protein
MSDRFLRVRAFSVVPVLAAALLLIPAPVALGADPPVLTDAIAPGVLDGTEGFGTSTVLVRKGGYITYLVRTSPALKGRSIEIWTDTGSGWKRTTTRVVASDGTARYHARVQGRVAFWAKLTKSGSTAAAASHGRTAGVSRDGRTVIRIGCDELPPTGSSTRVVASRRAQGTPSTTVSLVVCSNAANGYRWTTAAIDDEDLAQVGHTVTAGSANAGAMDTWSYRLAEADRGRVTLVYSQPWPGGEKAAWTVMLTVEPAG